MTVVPVDVVEVAEEAEEELMLAGEELILAEGVVTPEVQAAAR